jgi:chaperonin cofactor prefoldin
MADEMKISGAQLQKMFDAMKDNLESSLSEKIGGVVIDVQTLTHQQANGAPKKALDEMEGKINAKITELGANFTQFVEDAKKNQVLIDELAIDRQKRKDNAANKPDFKTAWSGVIEQFKEKKSEIEKLDLGQKISIKLPQNAMDFEEKAIMTIANTTTGIGTTTFNDRLGILPAQKINFRDILSTAPSDGNGSYVTYRETSAVQVPAVQTEGSAKANLQYTFSAITATLKYIAGFATFTKQLTFNLNFMQNKLPQMLLRDFYKAENAYLFNTLAGNSTGTSLPAGTLAKADVEEILQVIASQRGRNFDASYGIIDWSEWQRILATKPSDYSIPGGVLIDGNGIIRIAGMPIIPAAWAQTDHILVYDNYYYERVEGEALSVTISYENQDNFEKNQVTMKVECFEELNRLRDDASIYYDFGNS